MGPNFKPKLGKLIPLVIFLALAISLAEAKKLKETHLSFYIHDYTSGPNITDAVVTGIPGKAWSFTQFGTLYVEDDLITKTPDPKSAQIGRFQGISVISGLDGQTAYNVGSFVFTNKEYNGSTLQIQGVFEQFLPSTENSVVSGTGKFRFAKGYVTYEIYYVDIPNGYSITRSNVTVLHY